MNDRPTLDIVIANIRDEIPPDILASSGGYVFKAVAAMRERIEALEIEARTYEADAKGRDRLWNGHYVKGHYILTTPTGERVLCWPNAGFMNSSDGSDRQWAPCSNCTVRRIDLNEARPIVRGEKSL